MTQEENVDYVRYELTEALNLLYNEIKKSKFKRNIYKVIYSGMNGYNKVQSIDNSTTDKYIQSIEKKCYSRQSTEDVMKSIFENELVVGMFRSYFDTEYPPDIFDRFRGIDEALQYKYLISIDGETAAWKRPEWIMASDSVLFKTTTRYYQWYYDGLIPWVNYIPVRPDMSDVKEKINWARKNDDIVRQITRNANQFAQTVFSTDSIKNFMFDTIIDYTGVYSAGADLPKETPAQKKANVLKEKKEQKENHYQKRLHTLIVLVCFGFFIVIGVLQFLTQKSIDQRQQKNKRENQDAEDNQSLLNERNPQNKK